MQEFQKCEIYVDNNPTNQGNSNINPLENGGEEPNPQNDEYSDLQVNVIFNNTEGEVVFNNGKGRTTEGASFNGILTKAGN